MRITNWSTLLAWDNSYYMEVQPAHILVLIHDWDCIPEYNQYTGDTYLPLDDLDALAQEWSNFLSNKIYEIQKKLERGFHLYSYTNKIAVYGPRPSARRLFGRREIVKDPRMMTAKDHVPIVFYVVIMEQFMSMSSMRITLIRQIMIITQIQINRQIDMPIKTKCSQR